MFTRKYVFRDYATHFWPVKSLSNGTDGTSDSSMAEKRARAMHLGSGLTKRNKAWTHRNKVFLKREIYVTSGTQYCWNWISPVLSVYQVLRYQVLGQKFFQNVIVDNFLSIVTDRSKK